MRGCQRRVVFLKNTGSSIFEGAYFVLKEDRNGCDGKERECDMVLEASRIIEENFERKKGRAKGYLFYVVSFLIGAAVSAVLALLL